MGAKTHTHTHTHTNQLFESLRVQLSPLDKRAAGIQPLAVRAACAATQHLFEKLNANEAGVSYLRMRSFHVGGGALLVRLIQTHESGARAVGLARRF